jgi:hypothetical protein
MSSPISLFSLVHHQIASAFNYLTAHYQKGTEKNQKKTPIRKKMEQDTN